MRNDHSKSGHFDCSVVCCDVVELTRIELVSENKSTRVSPSAGYALHSLGQNFITKAMTLVVPYAWQKPELLLLTFTTQMMPEPMPWYSQGGQRCN